MYTRAIRRTAVRETSISRHYGSSGEGPLKPLGPKQTIVLSGLKGDLKCL